MKRDMTIVNKIALKIWESPTNTLLIEPLSYNPNQNQDHITDNPSVWILPGEEYNTVYAYLQLMETVDWVKKQGSSPRNGHWWMLTWSGHDHVDRIAPDLCN